MYIERIRIEEGFLDGLDVALVPGLNVVIGARGTGKTSLIELVRFCLGVSGYTAESGKRSPDHALSVLGAGQVTVTLSDGEQKIVVSRTAADEAPRTSSPFVPPIIFSQTEVESTGLQAGGGLRLLDGFVDDRRNANTQEIGATSEVRSLTAEAEALRREIDELRRQVELIPAIDKELVELAPAEQGVAKVSTEAAEKKKSLDALSAAMASTSVASASVDRFKQAISRWAMSLRGAIETVPRAEPWPEDSGDDLLVSARSQVQRAYTHLRNALEELGLAEAELADLAGMVFVSCPIAPMIRRQTATPTSSSVSFGLPREGQALSRCPCQPPWASRAPQRRVEQRWSQLQCWTRPLRSLLPFGSQALQQDSGLDYAELAGTTIPEESRAQVTTCTAQAGQVEEDRVECLSQPERRLAVSCIGGALVKKPCRSDIAFAEKHIPARLKCCGVRGGKASLRQTCCRRRRCRSAKLIGGRRRGRGCRGGRCGFTGYCGSRRRGTRIRFYVGCASCCNGG
jgi:hypothetical protein